MPPPNRLLARIKQIPGCGLCRGSGDWRIDEERGGVKRCDCLRGRLLRKSDQIREGKQVEQTELEWQ